MQMTDVWKVEVQMAGVGRQSLDKLSKMFYLIFRAFNLAQRQELAPWNAEIAATD